MPGFLGLLRGNRNYRFAWTGQVVSEIGDHFNNIAVFSLALATTHSGLVVSGVMLSRAVPAVLAGPLAGVILDRLDRRTVMIASDLIRAIVAALFIFTVHQPRPALLYVLSGLLMFASPFFTAGRAAILPRIANSEELHTANSLTQTTQWTTTTIGTFIGGFQRRKVWLLGGVRDQQPLVRGLGLGHQPSASSGRRGAAEGGRHDRGRHHAAVPRLRRGPAVSEGAAAAPGDCAARRRLGLGRRRGADPVQHLRRVRVQSRGPAGIGIIWAAAGFGLIVGGAIAHKIGPRLSFAAMQRTVAICYLVHGGSYVLFSQSRQFPVALFWIGLSRAAVAVSSVLNWSLLLRHVDDAFRGRVFATNESLVWATMMLSMLAAGLASQSVDPRTIGAVAGVVSSLTALYWLWADRVGLLVEPTTKGGDPDDVEVRTEMTA